MGCLEQLAVAVAVAAAAMPEDPASCARLWSCPPSDAVARKRLRDYPGACAPHLDGLALSRRRRWSPACLRAFLELLVGGTCGAEAPARPPSRRCVNLAPAGTGTLTLTRALRRAGLPECAPRNDTGADNAPRGCHHHHHGRFALADVAAPCVRAPRVLLLFLLSAVERPRQVVATLREPAARFASGLSYLLLRDARRRAPPRNASALLADFEAAYETRGGPRAPPAGFFGVPQVAHLAGLTCARRRGLHLLCTDALTADLDALGVDLDWPELRGEHANDRGATHAARADVERALTPAWRKWLNTEAYAADFAAFSVRCRGVSVDAAVAAVAPQPPWSAHRP